MATSPYRVPAPAGPESPPGEASPPLDLLDVAAFSWVVTLARVVAALVRAEGLSRELGLAWVILLLAPLVIWRELASRRTRS